MKKRILWVKKNILSLNKRQRFILAISILSLGFFFSEYLLGKSGVVAALAISILTPIFLLLTNYKDIRENFSVVLFILPFFYSLSFGLFYFLAPARFLTRIIMTSFYAVGLYSLFLSQNIFTVASIRTIALLSGARIVSFVITLISYFFLSNIVFTLDFTILPTAFLIFVFSFFLIFQSLWTYNLEKFPKALMPWALILSLCLAEVSLILWFWPTSPTVIALFLTGFFYTITGISHVFLDRRLFKGVMWEYIWVGIIVFLVLVMFTSWKG